MSLVLKIIIALLERSSVLKKKKNYFNIVTEDSQEIIKLVESCKPFPQ